MNHINQLCKDRIRKISFIEKAFHVNPGIIVIILMLIVSTSFAQWSQLGADINGEAGGDRSGVSISISSDGTRLAVGADNNDGSGSNAGHVRVYEYSGGSWIQLGTDINGEAADDNSGVSVSISADGMRVAIGADGNDGGGADAGHVRIYEYSGGGWIQLGSDINGEAADDLSGTSVSLSGTGNRVAIGAPNNDGSFSNAGHVRVYEYNGASWIQLGTDIDGAASADLFGTSVSISSDGTRFAVGAPYNDGNGSDAGFMRLYEYSGGSWSQLGATNDGEITGDLCGQAVSISADGTKVIVGSPGYDGIYSNAGNVRVYYYVGGGAWSTLGQKIEGEAENDNFGQSVSIFSDGFRIAGGANLNDGNGTDAGHVRVFFYRNGTWLQLNTNIDGEAANDQSGISVSMSIDGKVAAIGAHLNDGSFSDAGHVRIFGCNYIYNATDSVYYCSIAEALAAGSTNDGDIINIPAGTYSTPCLTISNSLTITPVGGPVTLGCLEMDGSGKNMSLGADLIIDVLTLSDGLIHCNGYNLSCGTILGGGPTSYIVTN